MESDRARQRETERREDKRSGERERERALKKVAAARKTAAGEANEMN